VREEEVLVQRLGQVELEALEDVGLEADCAGAAGLGWGRAGAASGARDHLAAGLHMISRDMSSYLQGGGSLV
jgi:hypothetical protein